MICGRKHPEKSSMSKRNEVQESESGGVRYHPETDSYRAPFKKGTHPTTAVVTTLAEIRHCEPVEIEPLYGVVDTDALDRIISGTTDSSVKVTFVVDGFEVTVSGDNVIEVVPPS